MYWNIKAPGPLELKLSNYVLVAMLILLFKC